MAKTVVHSSSAPDPIGPYSQAIAAGNMLFVSGQIAIRQQSGQMITDDIESETEQVMQNIGSILQAAGMNFSNVVKCSIFLSDFASFQKVNAIYGKYFPAQPPARETVEVSRLPKDANIEISCIAVK
jgi:2-iminobutanoate/2-iminopropanoate deaminase